MEEVVLDFYRQLNIQCNATARNVNINKQYGTVRPYETNNWTVLMATNVTYLGNVGHS